MTIYASNIQRLRILHESSFGTDGSGTLGNYSEVPFREGSFELTLTEPGESPMHSQQRVDGHPTEIALPRMATAVFEVNAETFTTKATSTVAATKSWLGMLLQSWMGGVHLMTGTTVNDAGADVNDWDGTVVTTLRPGAAVGLPTGTGGVLEVREIASKSSSNIVLKYDTSSAPSNGGTVYGSATYFANPLTTGAEFQSLQAVVEGYVTTDKWVVLGGCVTACEPVMENGQVARFKFTVEFAAWYPADGVDVSADLNAATLSEATYINTNTLVQADSEFCIAEVGTSNSAIYPHASSISFAPAITYAKVRSPGGVNTVAQWVRTHVSPVLTGKFVVPYEDQTWYDYRDAETPLALWLQVGSAPTFGAMVMSAPNIQITDVQRVNVDGIQSVEVSWVARHDTDTTAESGYEGLAQSAFRIHML